MCPRITLVLIMQPQNSVPDVIIWMISGKKHVAMKRIPSQEIMYASVGKARGKNCGKIQTITLAVSACCVLAMYLTGVGSNTNQKYIDFIVNSRLT